VGPEASVRCALLLVSSDPGLLDVLTRCCEERGHAVALAATARQAVTHLESGRGFDVVVAGWDAHDPVGGEVYRWVLAQRPQPAPSFVFVVDEPAPEYEALVGGRWLSIPPHDPGEILRVVERTAQGAAARPPGAAPAGRPGAGPTLLLADDDPFQLEAMAAVLAELGFRVTSCDGGHAAIRCLEREDFDVVLSDWNMPVGHGREVYRWICTDRPWMLDRLVFLTGSDPREPAQAAPGAKVFPKGQDAEPLVSTLTALAQQARRAS
jgi:CheY-like chemotaxis protein